MVGRMFREAVENLIDDARESIEAQNQRSEESQKRAEWAERALEQHSSLPPGRFAPTPSGRPVEAPSTASDVGDRDVGRQVRKSEPPLPTPVAAAALPTSAPPSTPAPARPKPPSARVLPRPVEKPSEVEPESPARPEVEAVEPADQAVEPGEETHDLESGDETHDLAALEDEVDVARDLLDDSKRELRMARRHERRERRRERSRRRSDNRST